MKVIHFDGYIFDDAINEYTTWLNKKQYTKVHFVNMVVEDNSHLHIIVTYE